MTARYGLIGHPVSHSLSPLIHNTAFLQANIDAVYEAVDLPELPRAIPHGYAGFNVTVPHKEGVFRWLDAIDDTAQRVGAVNTIVRRGDHAVGYNTDVTGFVRAAERHRTRIDGGRVAILGAGGAARAVVAGLMTQFHPREIRVVNRTEGRARELIGRFGDTRLRVGRGDGAFDAVIQTTSVGLQDDSLPIDERILADHPLVMDLIYHRETAFLKTARAAGCETQDGLEMLIAQAADSFRLWTGLEMPLDEVRLVLHSSR